jgi:hypothetical protein
MGETEPARQELTRAMQPEVSVIPRVIWPVQQPAAGALALIDSKHGEWNSSAFARALAAAAPECRDDCIGALTEAIAKRDPWAALLPADPIFDSLRGDPAFDSVVQAAMLPRQLQSQET